MGDQCLIFTTKPLINKLDRVKKDLILIHFNQV